MARIARHVVDLPFDDRLGRLEAPVRADAIHLTVFFAVLLDRFWRLGRLRVLQDHSCGWGLE